MRLLSFLLLATAALAQAPQFQPVGSISQLMVNIIYPTSDAMFYIERNPPKTEVEWNLIRNQALMLAESGNLLMLPTRVREGEWTKDAKALVDVGAAVYKAAVAKDMDGILALSEQLTAACINCHTKYHPAYQKKR